MTNTSSERAGERAGRVVLRDLPLEPAAVTLTGTDLRSGRWTRYGDPRVLGDTVTEAAVAGLADRVRSAARAQGYAAGWAEGTRRAQATITAAEDERAAATEQERVRAAEEQGSALSALTHAVDGCGEAARAAYDDITGGAVDLGLRVAEAVLGRELAIATDPGADALRRALAEIGPDVPVTVRMHPDDRALLDPAALEARPAAFVDDPSLQRGDAVVETDTQVVDATIAAALERVRQVLA
ncbi:MAG TPA: FliH/SctL family protein [Nocardioidaceae bacterium]|nr:FliH/SctL family protein [Nocardioidaceae bacterium]